jgi:hypothetical protein
MLFRTVYGPELEAIYTYLAEANGSLSRQAIHQAFMPTYQGERLASTQNIDDALSFLVAANLVEENGKFHITVDCSDLPFRLLALRQLQRLTKGEIQAKHKVDPLYMLILDELFIKPDRLFVTDVHAEANQVREVKEVGGLSREKLQAWKRVMTFLGVGQRIGNGFQCAYVPDLLLSILDCWSEGNGLLQSFFETRLVNFLPFETLTGDLAQAVSQPLLYLAAQRKITLAPRQDSPSKSYFGEQRFRYITQGGGA